jgi:YbgC/YbaW family acyl-CoA thioester hydrolase
MIPSVSIHRRVQWMDTDAAGIWHHSVVTRWTEEAEAELHRQLGIIEETFGATPRVRTEFEFGVVLRFDDLVEISLSVAVLGETSVTYQVEVMKGSTRAASGRLVAVFVDRDTGEKRPWTAGLREALAPSGQTS